MEFPASALCVSPRVETNLRPGRCGAFLVGEPGAAALGAVVPVALGILLAALVLVVPLVVLLLLVAVLGRLLVLLGLRPERACSTQMSFTSPTLQ